MGYPGEPFHTDATQINAWERFSLQKCGDLGSGYQYTIVVGGGLAQNHFLYAANGGGLADQGNLDTVRLEFTAHADNVWILGWPKFKFIRQSDGSYALQTSNGVNYVTALGGGGQVEKHNPADGSITKIFHTDATEVQAWERFKFIELGDCLYYIKTVSGKYVSPIYTQDTTLLSTDVAENAAQYFVLIPRDLNYHPEPAPAGPPRPHSYGVKARVTRLVRSLLGDRAQSMSAFGSKADIRLVPRMRVIGADLCSRQHASEIEPGAVQDF